MRWRKLLWGVKFTSGRMGDKPMLLGFSWHALAKDRGRYHGEPPRALLFTSRSYARSWCRAQHDQYRGRTDCCGQWRFTPIRVVEAVARCSKGGAR